MKDDYILKLCSYESKAAIKLQFNLAALKLYFQAMVGNKVCWIFIQEHVMVFHIVIQEKHIR